MAYEINQPALDYHTISNNLDPEYLNNAAFFLGHAMVDSIPSKDEQIATAYYLQSRIANAINDPGIPGAKIAQITEDSIDNIQNREFVEALAESYNTIRQEKPAHTQLVDTADYDTKLPGNVIESEAPKMIENFPYHWAIPVSTLWGLGFAAVDIEALNGPINPVVAGAAGVAVYLASMGAVYKFDRESFSRTFS